MKYSVVFENQINKAKYEFECSSQHDLLSYILHYYKNNTILISKEVIK